MAIINHYTRKPDSSKFDVEVIEHDGSVMSWILENISSGENFQVYSGELEGSTEISRNIEAMKSVKVVSVFVTPAGEVIIPLLISLVISVAVALLTPKPDPLDNVNRQQESPNNALSDRRNKARPNQRIVDIGGKVKSIPDVIQKEWSQYNKDNVEVRTGAYCVARKQVQIEDLKDGDSTFESVGESAGIYYPFKSPNNSSPDLQIGPLINEKVVGVFESSDGLDQTLIAPNEKTLKLFNTDTLRVPVIDGKAVGEIRRPVGRIGSFEIGDLVNINDLFIDLNPSGTPNLVRIGANTHEIIGRTIDQLYFNIDSDSSWGLIPFANYPVDTTISSPEVVAQDSSISIGPFTISSVKIDRIVFNAYAPGGFYKDEGNQKQVASVDYKLTYQKLSDDLQPVGPETPVTGNLTGATSNAIGSTININLGGLTFIRWKAERITDKDFDFGGNIVDDIKIKSLFGLYDVDRADFGDITMIQTQRKTSPSTTLIKSPEVNCIATELVNEYQGSGVFDPALTPNTRGIQTLIRVALDDRIGRRTELELDLDLLLSVQNEVDSYFPDGLGGTFNYSFDSTKTTAQETFYSICNAMFCIPWREGRVLKAFFEKPQIAPDMVFTHRSKKPNSETWDRSFQSKKRKDSIEFKYIDDELYTQETLYFPADRSGTNPLKLEITGIKGISQATWRMMREYNKLIYQNVSVDFTSTQEGRFVKPQKMISVVKGSRVGSFDGEVRSIDGLLIELSQDVVFTPSDDHFILLKRRDGTVESIPCFDIGKKRVVQLGFFPTEDIDTGTSARATEFSFGNESMLDAQLVLPQEVNASDNQYVRIKAINYSDKYYDSDPEQVIGNGFDSGFDSDGFF